MNQVLQYPDEVIVEGGKIPSVCITLPFEPQLQTKSTIEHQLKWMLAKAESRLLQRYSTRKAMPVLARLQQLIAGISYFQYKKSIALLASPDSSKIFYLEFPVTEALQVGEQLDTRNVVRSKRKAVHYLVLVLGHPHVWLYEGTDAGLTLIKHNVRSQQCSLHHIDQGLGFVLDAYPLPVFVLGQAAELEAFKKLTSYREQLIGYLPGNFDNSIESDILMTLQPEFHQWNKNKQQYLLQKLHKAREEGILSSGVKEVWNAATHKRGLLLVVEENFMSVPTSSTDKENTYALTRPAEDPFYKKDLVDDIIEKVLKDGGDVEFVETGTLTDFQQIALIQFHHREQAGS